MSEMPLRPENQQIQIEVINDAQPLGPYLGKTVLQSFAEKTALSTPSVLGPDQTPPVPFQTHTRSGGGMAQMTDDQDFEHLYE